MIPEEVKERWSAVQAKGIVAEYLEVEPDQEVFIIMDRYRKKDKKGRQWSNIVCSDVEALHRFIKNVGGDAAWFQDKPGQPHYDLYGAPKKRAMELLKDHLLNHTAIINFCRDFHPDYPGNPRVFKTKLNKQLNKQS